MPVAVIHHIISTTTMTMTKPTPTPLLHHTPNDNENIVKNDEMKRKKELRQRLVGEVLTEIQPIALGSLAMIASTLCNQGMSLCMNECMND